MKSVLHFIAVILTTQTILIQYRNIQARRKS